MTEEIESVNESPEVETLDGVPEQTRLDSNELPSEGSKGTEEPYECKVCSKTFSYKKTLARHVRNKHSPLGKPCICQFCQSRFNDKWAMGKHIQSTHMKKHHVVICPICNYKDSKIMIDIHFAKAHDIFLEEECHRFPSLEEFEKWKNKTEKSTVARFVVNQKFKKKNGAERIIYNCHRSGFFKPRGKNKRKIKSQGTNKIMGFCPARLEFEALENGEVFVQFIKTHVGHENEVEKVFSQTEIRYLNKKLPPTRAKSIEDKDVEPPRTVLIDYCQFGNLTVSELKPVVVRGFINNNNLISIISAPDDSSENFDSSQSESVEESATLHSATVINVNGITTVDLSGDMSLDVANVLDKDCGQTRPEVKFDIPDLGIVDHNISEVLDLSKLLAVRLGDSKLPGVDDSFEGENEVFPDLEPLDSGRFDALDGLENPKPPDEEPGLISIQPSPEPDQLSQDKQHLINRFIEIIQAVESRELLWEMKKICVPAMETMKSLFDQNFYENTC